MISSFFERSLVLCTQDNMVERVLNPEPGDLSTICYIHDPSQWWHPFTYETHIGVLESGYTSSPGPQYDGYICQIGGPGPPEDAGTTREITELEHLACVAAIVGVAEITGVTCEPWYELE
jgi:hypothetical protein